jgi:catecholate siderophore receptor
MSKISRRGVKSFKRSAFQAGAWFGAATFAAGSAHGQAAGSSTASGQGQDQSDVVEVVGQRLEEGLGTRYTAPLLETPQTITVVPREIMDQQNLLTMRDVLSTLPGITFTAGEGGGGYGDGVNLRGYTATNDISTDGVRDSAQYTRSDPFNLEQLELVSGANSVYTGAGSVGGSINLVTKTPRGREGTVLEIGGGGDSYARFTLDSETELGDVTDLRLNLMAHQNDVPGRDVERYERWGIAPSVAFGAETNTRMTLAYLHQQDDNIPQYGVPFALGSSNAGQLPGSPPSAYYGYRNVDRQESTIDALTATFNHDFDERVSVRNLTRWQHVDQYLVTNPPQGTWCIDSGINPWTGAVCATPGEYQPSGPRGTVRDTTNEILVNQTDFTLEFSTGAIQHTLVTGFSLSRESYQRDNGNTLRNPLGATPNPTLPPMAIAAPDNYYTGPLNFIPTNAADGSVDNRAAYVFDRLQLTERFEINGGIRYEHNDAQSTVATIATPYPAPPLRPVVTQGPVADNVDNLGSYRLGMVYKPSTDSSVYLAVGNSETPSQSSVNGTCTLIAADPANPNENCNVDPEEGRTVEVGGKWDLNGQLSLNAALFRNDRTNFRVNSGDPAIPEQQLDGSSRVDGVALGAAGQVGEKWSVFANYTYLDSEVLQNISDIAIGGGSIDITAGDPLPNTPEHSAGVWTTFQLSGAFTIGYGVTYQGEYTFSRASAAADLHFTPDYWVHRAMASYTFNDNLRLQFNVNNVTDEEYFERIRNNATNGWATPGAARNAVLSVNWQL